MPTLAPQTDATLDPVEVTFPRLGGKTIRHWTSYTISHHFTEPCGTWMLEMGDPRVVDELAAQVSGGDLIEIRVAGQLQMVGYVDDAVVHSGRSGTTFTFQGRDKMGPVVDSCCDPTFRLREGATIEDAIELLLVGPDKANPLFGFDFVDIDNSANVDLIRGGGRGLRRSKKGKELKSYKLKQIKPSVGEGVHEFLSDVCKRNGLYLWASADGTTAIVSSPTINQEPYYRIRNKTSGLGNNVIQSQVSKSWLDQPSVIFAGGHGYGGEWSNSTLRCHIVNPFTGFDEQSFKTPQVQAAIDRWPGSVELDLRVSQAQANTFKPNGVSRPLYIYDSEAETIEHLEFFTRRTLADLLRRSFVYVATVPGHVTTSADGESRSIWAVDTIVDVDDDLVGVHEPLYLLSKTFHKDRSGGTTTRLELVRPEAMVWTQQQTETEPPRTTTASSGSSPPTSKPITDKGTAQRLGEFKVNAGRFDFTPGVRR